MGNPNTFELRFLYYKWESRVLLRQWFYITKGKAEDFRERRCITNEKAEHYGGNGTLLQMGKPRAVQVTVIY